jgi:hypothetical protein
MTGGWRRPFEEPIEVEGRERMTLRDAGEYIAALQEGALPPNGKQRGLILVAVRGGPTMLARIGIVRALNRPRHIRG